VKELTDFEWSCLEALVRDYGAKYIAALVQDIEATQKEDDADYDEDGNLKPGVDHT
jgi:hypothetical protein